MNPVCGPRYACCWNSRGYVCIQAANGRDALQRMHGNSFDVLVTDYMMPQMDGLALARAVRQDGGRSLPVILVTGVPPAEAIPGGLVDRILQKPVKGATLTQAIRELLARGQG